MLMLTMTNDTESMFKVTIRIRPNNSFNYS